MKYLEYKGPLTNYVLEGFFLVSKCTLKLHTIIEVDALAQLLTTPFDTFASVQHSKLSFTKPTPEDAPGGFSWASALAVDVPLSEEDAFTIISLFDLSESPTVPIFPQLRNLVLQRMAVPVRTLIDMLVSRRTSGIGAQLASCRITEYRRLSSDELQQSVAKTARIYTLVGGGSSLMPSVQGIRGSKGFSFADFNPRMTWTEGLDREPQQKVRMERHQEDGLQVYMRHNFHTENPKRAFNPNR